VEHGSPIGIAEFRQALTPGTVRSLRIIQGAIGAGVLVFALVVLGMHARVSADVPPPPQVLVFLMQILTLVHFVMAATMYPLARFIFTRMVSRERLAKSGGMGPAGILSLMRMGIIMRLTMYEGVAFVGLVVCMVGVLEGVLRAYPVYWVNAFSTAVLLLFVMRTFPSEERLIAIFEERFRK
jgi:hypothetical protein